jgi:hypothetical protein
MNKSVNHPWAISDKMIARYGEIWANIDFVFNDKISQSSFKEDPMTTEIGELHIAGGVLKMTYKDIIAYAKQFAEKSAMYTKAPKTEKFAIQIKSKTYYLKPIEITRLSETMSDTLVTSLRAYELGLYL